ncbi:MAG: sigma-70 family RNA polymerase sigma factor [Bacteroidota bacterium]
MKNNAKNLNALLEGDSREIQKIYQKNFLKVKRFILQNKGQEADAEDIFQKALIQITVRYRREKFEITSSFEAYLFTACKNLWRRELNKSKKWVTGEREVSLIDEEQDQALALLEQKRWELFTQNMERISENCRKILRLFFAKVSYRKMMEQLNYNSENVVRQRVFKCKAKLAQLVKNDPRYNSLKEL